MTGNPGLGGQNAIPVPLHIVQNKGHDLYFGRFTQILRGFLPERKGDGQKPDCQNSAAETHLSIIVGGVHQVRHMANAFWRTVLRFDRAKIAPEIAVRNTIGIVLPLIVGASTGYVPAGVVASLGALNVSYSDSRDPYAARAQRMFRASVLVGIAVAAGGLSGHNTPLAVLTASLWAFAVGMLVVLGQKAADLGAVTLMTLLVFAARSLTVTEALGSGLLAFGAGLIQMLLSIAVWPVKPHEPERRIVAGLYEALSGIAVSSAGWTSAPPGTAPIMGAQESLATLADDRSIESERLVFLLNQAEKIRFSSSAHAKDGSPGGWIAIRQGMRRLRLYGTYSGRHRTPCDPSARASRRA